MTRSKLRLAAIVAGVTLASFGASSVRAEPPGAGFTRTLVAPQQRVGEPLALAIPGSSTVLVDAPAFAGAGASEVWRSSDGGRTFGPAARTLGGSGDSDIAVDPSDPSIVYALDIYDASALKIGGALNSTIPLSVSVDGGRSFSRVTPIAPAAQGFVWDRPWVATPGPGRVVVIARDETGGSPLADEMLWMSSDYGRTFSAPVRAAQVLNTGPLVVGPGGILNFAYMVNTTPPPSLVNVPPHVDIWAATSSDGANWQHQLIAANQTAAVLPVIAVDAAGSLYAAWSGLINNVSVVEFSSRPAGESAWRPPVTLSDPTLDPLGRPRPAVFPWVVAGDAGHAAVSYAIANQPVLNTPADLGGPATTWDIDVAEANNADAPTPRWTWQAAVTDFHTGSICTLTDGCVGPQSEGYGGAPTPLDRRELDFFGATMLPSGGVAVPYGHDQAITTPDPHSAVDVELARQ